MIKKSKKVKQNYLLILLTLVVIGFIKARDKCAYNYAIDPQQNLLVEVYRVTSTKT